MFQSYKTGYIALIGEHNDVEKLINIKFYSLSVKENLKPAKKKVIY